MLRKIFIGLLILSALTSRGAGGEISDIDIREKSSPDTFLNLCGEKRYVDGGAAESGELTAPRAISGFIGSAFVPPQEFVPVKSLEQHIYSNITGDDACPGPELFSRYVGPASFSFCEDLISYASGISPPAAA